MCKAISPTFYIAVLLSITFSVAAFDASAQVSSDNDAVVDQVGTDNEALIEQVGSLNRAGSDAQPIFQDGIYNNIDILQQGSGNRIGLTAPGVSQIGRQNTQFIFNQITIEQRSNGNTVGSVTQTSEGSVLNGANTLTVLQGGNGNNLVESVRQTQQDGQAGQVATIRQTGEFNRVALIEQLANSNAFGEDNSITVRMTGIRNGRIGLSGYAAEPSVLDNSVVQEAGNGDIRSNGNRVDLLITGDSNRFGIRQGGRMNDVGFITVTGDDNQLGLRQDGTENDIVIGAPIEGNENNIGIDQLGTNTVSLTLEALSSGEIRPRSDRNRIFIRQDGTNSVTFELEGDDNGFRIDQDYDNSGLGGDNASTISVLGNGNLGRVQQLGDNTMTIEIVGNDNNVGNFSRVSPVLGVVEGHFVQQGSKNDASAFVYGDANIIGTVQSGDNNILYAMIVGRANQAAISQSGTANLANVFQNGEGNAATVIQN